MGLKINIPMLRQLIEPVQLLYVMMFSTSLIHMDKIYIDKVCQVNLRDWIHELNLTTDVCHNLTRSRISNYSTFPPSSVSTVKISLT